MNHPVILESMEFPEPVIDVAIEPKDKVAQEKLGIALAKLAEEFARAERTLIKNSDPKEIANARLKILQLSERVQSLEDMDLLDELIQEKLKNF